MTATLERETTMAGIATHSSEDRAHRLADFYGLGDHYVPYLLSVYPDNPDAVLTDMILTLFPDGFSTLIHTPQHIESFVKRRLTHFYAHHNPDKVDRVDAIIAQYKDKGVPWHQLLGDVLLRYYPQLDSVADLNSEVMDVPPSSIGAHSRRIPTFRDIVDKEKEAEAKLKHKPAAPHVEGVLSSAARPASPSPPSPAAAAGLANDAGAGAMLAADPSTALRRQLDPPPGGVAAPTGGAETPKPMLFDTAMQTDIPLGVPSPTPQFADVEDAATSTPDFEALLRQIGYVKEQVRALCSASTQAPEEIPLVQPASPERAAKSRTGYFGTNGSPRTSFNARYTPNFSSTPSEGARQNYRWAEDSPSPVEFHPKPRADSPRSRSRNGASVPPSPPPMNAGSPPHRDGGPCPKCTESRQLLQMAVNRIHQLRVMRGRQAAQSSEPRDGSLDGDGVAATSPEDETARWLRYL